MEKLEFFDQPALNWPGSKWKLADWIIEQMPPHVTYVEPYCGSCAVFLRKFPSPIEILNDINSDVVNFFKMLRDQEDALIRAIELSPYAREEFEQAHEPIDDPLERARRFYVLTSQNFGGGNLKNNGWRHQKVIKNGVSPAVKFCRTDDLRRIAQRFKTAHIECDDALRVIKRFDTPKTIFYVDPPYLLTTRSQGRKRKRYQHEMTDDDHRALAVVLRQVKGMVLLSGYDSNLYRELYSDWLVTSKSTTTNGNSTAREYLWLSPNATSLQSWPLLEGVEAIDP